MSGAPIFAAATQGMPLDCLALEARGPVFLATWHYNNQSHPEKNSYRNLTPRFLRMLPGDTSVTPSSGGQWGLHSWVPLDCNYRERVLEQLPPLSTAQGNRPKSLVFL